jgi:ATP-dependent DNA helicase DinG
MDQDIEYYLGPDSPLGDSLKGFAPREGQLDMAQAVAAALESGSDLIVEAGTGTGKTLAYLMPAILSGRRVVISTGTKTLQDQLYHRDLPTVSAALGRPVKVRQLKGRANYLCKHRLELALEDGANAESGVVSGQLRKLDTWSRLTRSGDVGEVKNVAEDSPVWRMVTSTVDNCLGSDCPEFEDCYLLRARQQALSADIVVVNHHLLMADLVLKEEGFGELLPGCEAVIVDEAHKFPDVAQSFFNQTFSSGRLTELANDLRSEAVAALLFDRRLDAALDDVGHAVKDARIGLPDRENNIGWDDLPSSFIPNLHKVLEAIQYLIDWLEGLSEDHLLPPLQRCLDRARGAYDTLEQLLGADPGKGLRWVGLTRMGFSCNYTPVDIAASLSKLLDEQHCSWIFTSATLAVDQDFSHFLARLGLKSCATQQIPSPFDYMQQTLLYLPDKLPAPNSPGYTAAVLETVKPLIQQSGGRAFLLFTSHRALREAATLLERDTGFTFPLLVQGRSPRTRLLEQFVALDNPVLLGTSSFWEGVDMRGDNLVLVVIDKLPFASPGDPMLQVKLEAIAAAGGNPFRDYQLPQAALNLKQGVGRLIRDVDDWGVVVLCDPRLTGSGYGKLFLDSLPAMPQTRDEAEAKQFFINRQASV